MTSDIFFKESIKIAPPVWEILTVDYFLKFNSIQSSRLNVNHVCWKKISSRPTISILSSLTSGIQWSCDYCNTFEFEIWLQKFSETLAIRYIHHFICHPSGNCSELVLLQLYHRLCGPREGHKVLEKPKRNTLEYFLLLSVSVVRFRITNWVSRFK